MDDGSTDNTKETVNRFIENNNEDFFVKYVYQKNSGSQVARNAGTTASTGEFIQYLDSDDLLYPQKLEKQIAFLNKHPECDGVWGGWAKGSIDKYEEVEALPTDNLIMQFLTAQSIVNFSFLMRKSIIKSIGSWDTSIKRNQEIDFHLRGLLVGANYQYQPQITGLWRIHEGARIGTTTGVKEFSAFYKKWENILADKGLLNEIMKTKLANTYFWLANSNRSNKAQSLFLLEETLRLNPHATFARTKKMLLLKSFLGLRNALKLWMHRTKVNPDNIK